MLYKRKKEMKKKLLATLVILFFGISPQPVFSACCDIFAVKFFEADAAALAFNKYIKLLVVPAILGQGSGIQGQLSATDTIITTSVLSMAKHITQSFAKQTDARRKAEFETKQQMDMTFGLGLTPCCEVGNGVAAGTRNAWTYTTALTQGLGQNNRFRTGRESVNFKRDLQKKYEKVTFIEPSGLMYTPLELEAAQNTFGGLADMFPPASPRLAEIKLTPAAQADYDGAVQIRQWILEGARLAPLSSWIAHHSALIPSESWLEAYKGRTGLHEEVKTQNGNLSPRAIQRLKADEALAIASNTERLKLNEKGLYVELVKLYSEQYAVDVELLTAVKRLPLQLALQNKDALKQLEEYLNAFKTQRK